MQVVFDFDGTLTAADTMGALGAAAVAFQTEQGSGEGGGPAWASRWQAAVDAYTADYAAHRCAAPAPAQRTTLAAEAAFQESLRGVELRSLERVAGSGLFAGMAESLAAAGQASVEAGAVVVQRGAAAFVARAAARRWAVSVVSVNWSDAWVRGVLRAAMPLAPAFTVLANTVTDRGSIVRNCLLEDEAAGPLLKPLVCAADKLLALQGVAQAAAAARWRGDNDDGGGGILYFGDSPTDVECVLHAGSATSGSGGGGIVVAGAAAQGAADNALLATLARLGYNVPHVSAAEAAVFLGGGVGATDDALAEPRLAWARDFDEVASWLFGAD